MSLRVLRTHRLTQITVMMTPRAESIQLTVVPITMRVIPTAVTSGSTDGPGR